MPRNEAQTSLSYGRGEWMINTNTLAAITIASSTIKRQKSAEERGEVVREKERRWVRAVLYRQAERMNEKTIPSVGVAMICSVCRERTRQEDKQCQFNEWGRESLIVYREYEKRNIKVELRFWKSSHAISKNEYHRLLYSFIVLFYYLNSVDNVLNVLIFLYVIPQANLMWFCASYPPPRGTQALRKQKQREMWLYDLVCQTI